MNKAFSKYDFLLLLLILAENFTLFFYSVNLGQQWLNASCYFLSSLLIGLVLIGKFRNKTVIRMQARKPAPKIWVPVALLSVLFLAFLVIKDSRLFQDIPIDPARSDVIPTIQVLVRRLLQGASVYQPIEEFGYYLPVTYLPLQWIVYTPAEVFGFDYRWVTFIIWLTGSLFILIRLFKIRNAVYQVFIPFLLFGIYYLLLYKHNDVISNTVETMVAGYYMIFIISLNQKSAILQGAAIALCMLSRYSLVVWLPLWTLVLFLSGARKHLFLSILTTIVIVLLVYILPFLSHDWAAFSRSLRAYDGAALGEWNRMNDALMKPHHLNSGVGFAFFFADKYPDNLSFGLKLLQRTHLAMCLLTVLLMGVWYLKNKNKIQHNIFLMASFKIYLSVFLFFIQVPYIYLMIVANFVSIAIFVEQLRYKGFNGTKDLADPLDIAQR